MRYTSKTSSLIKDVYVPKDFINHAASLRQAFAHCGRFSTAATRRCMDRVSVPSVGVSALTPPKRHSLGRPLPYQLADSDAGRSKALQLYSCGTIGNYPSFDELCPTSGTFLRVTTSFATNSNDFHLDIIALPFKGLRSTCMPYPRRQRSS